MRAKKGKETVDGVLDGLVEYTRTHFKAEKAAFAANGYPGALFVTVETLEFLSSWLKKHIMDTDRKYGLFLAGKVT